MNNYRMAGVTLTVQSVKRSLDFYCDKLGMVLEINAAPHFGQVKMAGGTLGFQSWAAAKKDGAVKMSTKQKRAIHIEIHADDIDELFTELKASGVKFLRKPQGSAMENSMVALDPDGYAIAISEER